MTGNKLGDDSGSTSQVTHYYWKYQFFSFKGGENWNPCIYQMLAEQWISAKGILNEVSWVNGEPSAHKIMLTSGIGLLSNLYSRLMTAKGRPSYSSLDYGNFRKPQRIILEHTLLKRSKLAETVEVSDILIYKISNDHIGMTKVSSRYSRRRNWFLDIRYEIFWYLMVSVELWHHFASSYFLVTPSSILSSKGQISQDS